MLGAIGVTELDWRPGDDPDVAWKPGNSIAGVTPDEFGASWSSDPAHDGEYAMQWKKATSKLKLGDGPEVVISGNGTYTLTCTQGSVSVGVVAGDRPGSDANGVLRVVPARTLASVP